MAALLLPPLCWMHSISPSSSYISALPTIPIAPSSRTYIHTYIRTYVRTYIYTYVHTYVAEEFPCLAIGLHAGETVLDEGEVIHHQLEVLPWNRMPRIVMEMGAHIHTCMHKHTHVHIPMHTHTHTHIRPRMRTLAHSHAHPLHMHTHAQIRS
eukprot:GHVU01223820.1.p2 GENE.GHVU01223820.1~~GHVU01223820.1.p2  ORF type:complete len:153 (-),score=7.14 GHVU01223820.1:157-615(-)